MFLLKNFWIASFLLGFLEFKVSRNVTRCKLANLAVTLGQDILLIEKRYHTRYLRCFLMNIPRKGQQLQVSAKVTNVCHIMRCHRLTNSCAPTFFLDFNIQKVEQEFRPLTREKLRSSEVFGFLAVPCILCQTHCMNSKEQRTTNTTKNEWRKNHQK